MSHGELTALCLRFVTEPQLTLKRTPVGFQQVQRKPTILVVDDDENSLSALKNLLRPTGYRVLQAGDGRQAIEVVIAEKLDLILLDLQLPKLDGLGVIRHLRENLNLSSLPIVMMTACDSEESLGHAMACGCDEFLSKPIDFDRLEAVLDHFIPLRAES